MIKIFVPNAIEEIPHGSGIDGKWFIDEKGGKLHFHNFYHGMNGNGYYDGYADFSVIVPIVQNGDFTDFKD